MRIKILLLGFLIVAVLFPLSLHAQDMGTGSYEGEMSEETIYEEQPDIYNQGNQNENMQNPANDSVSEEPSQPTPTPPQNLTYLDYYYYVRARYGGTVPQDIITDYNGDGKINEQDKSIILQALNPDYDPATITPSPTITQQADQGGPFNSGGNTNTDVDNDASR
jgi:hypothetical protein